MARSASSPVRSRFFHTRARTKDRADGLKKMLAERADKEVSDITAILTELQAAIQGQLNDPFYQQNFLPGFAPAGQRGADQGRREANWAWPVSRQGASRQRKEQLTEPGCGRAGRLLCSLLC